MAVKKVVFSPEIKMKTYKQDSYKKIICRFIHRTYLFLMNILFFSLLVAAFLTFLGLIWNPEKLEFLQLLASEIVTFVFLSVITAKIED